MVFGLVLRLNHRSTVQGKDTGSGKSSSQSFYRVDWDEHTSGYFPQNMHFHGEDVCGDG
jgi:hypothetical protein